MTGELAVTVVSSFGGTRGGAEQWLISALEHARGLRIRAVLLAPGPLEDVLAGLGADVVVIPTGSSGRALAGANRALFAELRAHRPDVVLANGVKAMAAVVGAATVLRIPRVWIKHDHSHDARLAKPLGRYSTTVVATALEVGVPTGRDDLVVIEPERPREPMTVAEARAELAERGFEHDPEHPACVMIGRVVPYKGVDIGIMSLAYRAAANWRLVVIGEIDTSLPDEAGRLSNLAERIGVTDRVVFLGGIPAAGRLIPAFEATAVLTRPGQARAPDREGYGITATESMLAGVPVIAAGQGPIARRLATTEGPAGIVVPQSDPLAVAQAMAELSDPAVRGRMGAAGRSAAAHFPDADDVSARLVAVLAKAAAGGRGP